MEFILLFLKSWKNKSYDQLNDLLVNIRTGDLREMLPELGTKHRYYSILFNILNNSDLYFCHSEALYNLAVILGHKDFIPDLISDGVLDLVLKFVDSVDKRILFNCIWCLFGLSSSTFESRKICLSKGVLKIAINIMISRTEKIQDIAGQVLYGIFHLKPLPDLDEMYPLFQHGSDLLKLPESILKYVLWSLHFASITNSQLIIQYELLDYLIPLLKSQNTTILIPLLIIIGSLYKSSINRINLCILELIQPLNHIDVKVKLQTCRTISDFINLEEDVNLLLKKKIFHEIINVCNDEDLYVRQQAVYTILRGFGLGNEEHRRDLANIGGLKAVLEFSLISSFPFNVNLLDCMNSLIEFDYEFMKKKIFELNAVNLLYKLLSDSESIVSSKAANLIGLIGDNYNSIQKN